MAGEQARDKVQIQVPAAANELALQDSTAEVIVIHHEYNFPKNISLS